MAPPESCRPRPPPRGAWRRRGALQLCGRAARAALALQRQPDLVLFDEDCPLVDARSFARILRSNPRTAAIPVVLVSRRGAGRRAGVALEKPLREEDVVARADQVLRRAAAARAAAASRELEGDLAEFPLGDLLQVLGVNRRSGRLVLDPAGERGEILLRDGRVADASAGAVRGEKALYRLLTRREGPFTFAPGPVEGPATIDRRVEEVVLEGARHADEAAVLRDAVPAPGETLELCRVEELPPELHPVTAEVVALLERPLPLAELLDRAEASDLEVLRAVETLLARGFARRREGPVAPSPAPILDPAAMQALRDRVARGRASGAQAVSKVAVAGGGPLSRRAALSRLAALPGFLADPAPPTRFGTLGRLDLGEGLRVDICELPLDLDHLPVFRAFAAGALGALLLLPADGLGEGHATALRDLGVPVVAVGPSAEAIPAALADGPAPPAFGGADPAEGLRALLAGAGRISADRLAPP
jgi:CheY-like chemotaxis protein